MFKLFNNEAKRIRKMQEAIQGTKYENRKNRLRNNINELIKSIEDYAEKNPFATGFPEDIAVPEDFTTQEYKKAFERRGFHVLTWSDTGKYLSVSW